MRVMLFRLKMLSGQQKVERKPAIRIIKIIGSLSKTPFADRNNVKIVYFPRRTVAFHINIKECYKNTPTRSEFSADSV